MFGLRSAAGAAAANSNAVRRGSKRFMERVRDQGINQTERT
jgi:hypothetical protein